jgi:predicted GIY-YIG superfamily endonuclease
MQRRKKEIKAVIVPPKNEQTLRLFEKRMCDFYALQVEQRLRSLPKEQKLEIVDALLASTYQ